MLGPEGRAVTTWPDRIDLAVKALGAGIIAIERKDEDKLAAARGELIRVAAATPELEIRLIARLVGRLETAMPQTARSGVRKAVERDDDRTIGKLLALAGNEWRMSPRATTYFRC
jgi:hypothetical protein